MAQETRGDKLKRCWLTKTDLTLIASVGCRCFFLCVAKLLLSLVGKCLNRNAVSSVTEYRFSSLEHSRSFLVSTARYQIREK